VDTGWVLVNPSSSTSDSLTLSDYIANGNGFSYDVVVECFVKKNPEDTPISDIDSYTWSV